jgi:RimJ/RimL family protein N-acetyltransferase
MTVPSNGGTPAAGAHVGAPGSAHARPGLLDAVSTIHGRLVSLRPISREDYPTLFRWRSSFGQAAARPGDSVHWLNFRRRIGPFEEFVRELEAMLPNCILLLVRRAQTGDAIGYALGYNIDPWDGSMGVTMYLEDRFQKRGYGGEASLLWADFLFRTFPLRKLTAEIYEFAEPTLAIVQAMGAEEVGFMPEHFWHESRYWGVHFMVLRREVWEKRRWDFAAIIGLEAHSDGALESVAHVRPDGRASGLPDPSR